jgi:nitroreductase
MDIIEAIKARRSIRAYKTDPVPRKVLEEILIIATHAPSSVNSQPWEFVIVTGDKLNELKEKNLAARDSGERPEYVLYPGTGLPDLIALNSERSNRITARILEAMGVHDDKEARINWARRGLRLFDAPAMIYILMDKKYMPASYFDIGMVAHSICVTALNYGIGTIISAQSVMYPRMIRNVLGIPDNKNPVIGIPIGYPDWSHPANKTHVDREPLEKITTWTGF